MNNKYSLLDHLGSCPSCGLGHELEIASVNRRLYALSMFPYQSTRPAVGAVYLSCGLTPQTWVQPFKLVLLSCTQAEIYVMLFLLPINGCHISFTTHRDIRQHFHLFIRVARPRKHIGDIVVHFISHAVVFCIV
jgi:hypothetical protein